MGASHCGMDSNKATVALLKGADVGSSSSCCRCSTLEVVGIKWSPGGKWGPTTRNRSNQKKSHGKTSVFFKTRNTLLHRVHGSWVHILHARSSFPGHSPGTPGKKEKKGSQCLTIRVQNKIWLRSWSRSLRKVSPVEVSSGNQAFDHKPKQAKTSQTNTFKHKAERPLNLEETTEERKVNNLVSKNKSPGFFINKKIKNAKKWCKKHMDL